MKTFKSTIQDWTILITLLIDWSTKTKRGKARSYESIEKFLNKKEAEIHVASRNEPWKHLMENNETKLQMQRVFNETQTCLQLDNNGDNTLYQWRRTWTCSKSSTLSRRRNKPRNRTTIWFGRDITTEHSEWAQEIILQYCEKKAESFSS